MTRFGLLLPHFGEHADPNLLVRGAQRAEELGFDSLWVRDHIVFEPHTFEGRGAEFLEPLLTLTFLAASTSTIELGTATVTPHRHPLHLAQSVSTLAFLARRPLNIAFGAGGAREFGIIGLGAENRPDLMREHIQIASAVWRGEALHHSSERYVLDDVAIHPAPKTPIWRWWGGATPASTRLAVDYCDGWLPGRINFATYEARTAQIRERCEERGVPMIRVGAIPIVSIDDDPVRAKSFVDVPTYLNYANEHRYWIKPADGDFTTLKSLEGSIMAGTPDDVVSIVQRYQEIGCDQLVFDFRLRFADWLEQMERLAAEVLPRVRDSQTASPTTA